MISLNTMKSYQFSRCVLFSIHASGFHEFRRGSFIWKTQFRFQKWSLFLSLYEVDCRSIGCFFEEFLSTLFCTIFDSEITREAAGDWRTRIFAQSYRKILLRQGVESWAPEGQGCRALNKLAHITIFPKVTQESSVRTSLI